MRGPVDSRYLGARVQLPPGSRLWTNYFPTDWRKPTDHECLILQGYSVRCIMNWFSLYPGSTNIFEYFRTCQRCWELRYGNNRVSECAALIYLHPSCHVFRVCEGNVWLVCCCWWKLRLWWCSVQQQQGWSCDPIPGFHPHWSLPPHPPPDMGSTVCDSQVLQCPMVSVSYVSSSEWTFLTMCV